MTRITYLPWEEIVLHEVLELDVPEFFQSIVAQIEAQKQAGTPSVSWIDGVAFFVIPFPDTPETISEKLRGKLHFLFVAFTQTSFQPEKKVQFEGREHIVRLAKAENNPNLVDLVKYLKTYRPTNAKTQVISKSS
jgi:hypothetical protein